MSTQKDLPPIGRHDFRFELMEKITRLVEVLYKKYGGDLPIVLVEHEDFSGPPEYIAGQAMGTICALIPWMIDRGQMLQAAEKFSAILVKLDEVGVLNGKELAAVEVGLSSDKEMPENLS